MAMNKYLKWLSETNTYWWNDDADMDTMDIAIDNGSTGVTTNPLLVKKSLYAHPDYWRPNIAGAKDLTGDAKAEEIIRGITVQIAKKYQPIYEKSGGVQGYVCAQVNPKKQGDTAEMIEIGLRLAAWAPNIAVKVPATAAGIRAIEDHQAQGLTTVGTVCFTVSQAPAIAAAQLRVLTRCRKAGIKPGKAFSVIMVGRLDDYLRYVVHDLGSSVPEEHIICAGTACIKRAYKIAREAGYETKLMPAGMRGAYHATDLAGSDMSFSLSAGIHVMLGKVEELVEMEDYEIPAEIIESLMSIPEFKRAYEPNGLPVSEFITYGVTQRTLSQFVEAGWTPISEFEIG